MATSMRNLLGFPGDLWLRLLLINGRTAAVARQIRNCHPDSLAHLLRAAGASVGEANSFKGSLTLTNVEAGFGGLTIGNHSFFGEEVFLDLANPITFGDEVAIGARSAFITHSDVGNRPLRTLFCRLDAPIVLEQGCWVGVGAIVLPGVRVGKCALVGAGSVVTKDVPPFTVVAGVPARPLRTLTGE